MENQNGSTKIITLLNQAGGAHHTYEQAELNGVYDKEWPLWYAEYIINNGFNELVDQPFSADQLGLFFAETNQLLQQSEESVGWAEFTAAKISERFGGSV